MVALPVDNRRDSRYPAPLGLGLSTKIISFLTLIYHPL
jgi:hypothetical protein